MKEAQLTNDIIVKCPHCGGENNVQFSDMGDEFECQFMHCSKWFSIPSKSDYFYFLHVKDGFDI